MKVITTVSLLVFLFIFSGCSSRNVIVLLPDRDGNVGAIDVTNDKGSVSIDKPGATVNIASSSNTPKFVGIMSEEDIANRFKEALAAEPKQPAKFLLYFKTDSNVLTSDSKKLIPDIIIEIRSRDSHAISVSGHTDSTGSRSYNIELSTKRANAVRDILLSEGVDSNYLHVNSHGENNPLYKTPDNVAEPKNRRAEVIVK